MRSPDCSVYGVSVVSRLPENVPSNRFDGASPPRYSLHVGTNVLDVLLTVVALTSHVSKLRNGPNETRAIPSAPATPVADSNNGVLGMRRVQFNREFLHNIYGRRFGASAFCPYGAVVQHFDILTGFECVIECSI